MNRSMHTRSLVAALLLVLVAMVLSLPAQAGGGPENVLLVVNADSWSSMTLANEFVRLRQVPAGNIVYLHLNDLGDQSTIDVQPFRDRILGPALAAIKDRKLTEQIDYIVYSSDIQYGVNVKPDMTSGMGQIITPVAATTGLTFLNKAVMEKDYAKYLSLTVNRYARQVVQASLDTAKLQRFLQVVLARIDDKKYDQADEVMQKLVKALPANVEVLYTYACLQSAQGKADAAIATLTKAVDRGFNRSGRAETDKYLAALGERKDFKELLKRMNNPKLASSGMDDTLRPQQTVGFRSALSWTDKEPKLGESDSYMLSTMLGWTGGRGISVRQSLAAMRRSVAADGTCPKGTFYFMLNTDIRSQTRKWGFAATAARLRELGFAAEIVDGVMPKDRKDVLGLVAGSADFDIPGSGCEIMPGAIAETLTSLAGVLRDDSYQTPCTEWLRYGAAGSSGTVTEPFAVQNKFPVPFIQLHYASGCSLAEAYYQSVSGPYQLTIVGDPLCQPWAAIPTVAVGGVKAGETVKGTVTLEPRANDTNIAQWLLFVDGKRTQSCAPGQKFTVDTAALADGQHEFRVVVVRDGAILTQGRAIVPVTVANSGRTAKAALAAIKVTWPDSTTLTLSAKGAKSIVVLANGLEIGKVDGDSGDVKIKSTSLGMGDVSLQAVAVYGDSTADRVTTAPQTLTIEQPAAIDAVPAATAAMLELEQFNCAPLPAIAKRPSAYGFMVALGNGPAKPMEPNMNSSNWLGLCGSKKNQPFTLQGYIKAPTDELYQLQAYFEGPLKVEIDGQSLTAHDSVKGWRYHPVALKAGWHEMKISGTPVYTIPGDPYMQLRFGAAGTPPITTESVTHLVK